MPLIDLRLFRYCGASRALGWWPHVPTRRPHQDQTTPTFFNILSHCFNLVVGRGSPYWGRNIDNFWLEKPILKIWNAMHYTFLVYFEFSITLRKKYTKPKMYNSHLLIESNSIFSLLTAVISHLAVLKVRLSVDAHRKLWGVEGKNWP